MQKTPLLITPGDVPLAHHLHPRTYAATDAHASRMQHNYRAVNPTKAAQQLPFGNRHSRLGIFCGIVVAMLTWFMCHNTVYSQDLPNYAHGSNLYRKDDVFRSYYQSWRDAFVTSSGASGHLRVIDNEDNDRTVSEGIGYGMLLSVYADDKSTFQRLWEYAKRYHNSRGLMAWLVDRNGNVQDWACATDADLDMAFALIVADKKGWGNNYGTDATNLCKALLKHCVDSKNVLKPGDVFGGSDLTNPSYFSPAYYVHFAKHTGDNRWNNVRDKCYEIFDAINRRNNNTGLSPKDCNADGAKVNDNYSDGSDSCRVPWRLAKDYAWHGESKAKNILDKLNSFYIKQGAYNIKGEYFIDGKEKVSWGNVQWRLAPIACSAVASNNSTFRSNMWDRVRETQHDRNYYGRSLQVLGIMFASGVMVPPDKISSSDEIKSVSWPSQISSAGPVTVTADISVSTERTIELHVWDSNWNWRSKASKKTSSNGSITLTTGTYSSISTSKGHLRVDIRDASGNVVKESYRYDVPVSR